MHFFLSCSHRGYSLASEHKRLTAVASLRVEHGPQQLRLPGSRAQRQWRWCTGLVTPGMWGPPRSPETELYLLHRQASALLHHWATREASILITLNRDAHRVEDNFSSSMFFWLPIGISLAPFSCAELLFWLSPKKASEFAQLLNSIPMNFWDHWDIRKTECFMIIMFYDDN